MVGDAHARVSVLTDGNGALPRRGSRAYNHHMPRAPVPTPVENKGSKPYRIYADVYGDQSARSHRPVADAMSPLLVCLAPHVPLAAVRRLLERQHLTGAPVIGDGEELLGIVIWEDLLAASGEVTAGEVMHRPLALPSWTPIGKAAAIMSSEHIDLAVVVDAERRVQGLLSALDIVRWLAREDGYVLSRQE
jgi:CBS domain-containing protein